MAVALMQFKEGKTGDRGTMPFAVVRNIEEAVALKDLILPVAGYVSELWDRQKMICMGREHNHWPILEEQLTVEDSVWRAADFEARTTVQYTEYAPEKRGELAERVAVLYMLDYLAAKRGSPETTFGTHNPVPATLQVPVFACVQEPDKTFRYCTVERPRPEGVWGADEPGWQVRLNTASKALRDYAVDRRPKTPILKGLVHPRLSLDLLVSSSVVLKADTMNTRENCRLLLKFGEGKQVTVLGAPGGTKEEHAEQQRLVEDILTSVLLESAGADEITPMAAHRAYSTISFVDKLAVDGPRQLSATLCVCLEDEQQTLDLDVATQTTNGLNSAEQRAEFLTTLQVFLESAGSSATGSSPESMEQPRRESITTYRATPAKHASQPPGNDPAVVSYGVATTATLARDEVCVTPQGSTDSEGGVARTVAAERASIPTPREQEYQVHESGHGETDGSQWNQPQAPNAADTTPAYGYFAQPAASPYGYYPQYYPHNPGAYGQVYGFAQPQAAPSAPSEQEVHFTELLQLQRQMLEEQQKTKPSGNGGVPASALGCPAAAVTRTGRTRPGTSTQRAGGPFRAGW
jgi:hypothetical protein